MTVNDTSRAKGLWNAQCGSCINLRAFSLDISPVAECGMSHSYSFVLFICTVSASSCMYNNFHQFVMASCMSICCYCRQCQDFRWQWWKKRWETRQIWLHRKEKRFSYIFWAWREFCSYGDREGSRYSNTGWTNGHRSECLTTSGGILNRSYFLLPFNGNHYLFHITSVIDTISHLRVS